MKPKKIKARRYWRMPHGMKLYGTREIAQYYSGFAALEVAPIVVLPADAASVERTPDGLAMASFLIRCSALVRRLLSFNSE